MAVLVRRGLVKDYILREFFFFLISLGYGSQSVNGILIGWVIQRILLKLTPGPRNELGGLIRLPVGIF